MNKLLLTVALSLAIASTALTASFPGDETISGTLTVTGASTLNSVSATAGTFSGAVSSGGQIANLDWIDVSRAPYNADMTGAADSTTPLNDAIAAAISAKKAVYIPRAQSRFHPRSMSPPRSGFVAPASSVGEAPRVAQ